MAKGPEKTWLVVAEEIVAKESMKHTFEWCCNASKIVMSMAATSQ
jgi:hypothetical protein